MQLGQTIAAPLDVRSWWARAGLAHPREIFGTDLRTLALFRVLLGLCIIFDLCLRARDIRAHYSDFGVMPRGVLVDYLAPGAFSLHMLNGTAAFQIALFVLAGIFALMMVAGWRTRLATVASWVLLLSLQNRNTVILSGEDQLLILLLFWGMFLPLGARYSVDSALDLGPRRPSSAFFSVATVALLIQGMSMYFFSALLKSDPIWIPDGTAVYYALNLDYFATPFALWFRQFDGLLQGLTYYVWTLELVGPILIFSPLLHRPLRAALMVAFMTMHLGFLLCLEIGLFPLVSIVMVLTFTPGWMWDKLAEKLRPRGPEELRIWYDRDCDFCLKTARLARVFLCLSPVPLRPAQDDPEAGPALRTHNSWVVEDGDARYLKWDAVRRLVARSPLFWPLAGILALGALRRLGDRIYLWVADKRPGLGRLTAAILPWRPMTIAPSRLGNLLAGLFLLLVTVQNVTTLPASPFRLPDPLVQLRQLLGLYQNWTMFAPYPELNSPWPVIVGELTDGSVADVYNQRHGAPDFSKPAVVSAVYENYRWRKYLSNLEDQTYEDVPQRLALNYGRYLCRRWNADADPERRLSTFQIIFNVERTPPPGEFKEATKRVVWTHDCFG